MLVFGHLGVTLGVGLIASGLVTTIKHKNDDKTLNISIISPTTTTSTVEKLNRQLSTLGHYVDIRLLLIGSILPDLIDKPLGHCLLPAPFDGGRIFGHTLLFLMLVTFIALYLHMRRRKTYLYAVSFGVLMHLITDEMWLSHETLIWPIFGIEFESAGVVNWFSNIFHVLFTYPSVYIPEIIGVIIIGWFLLQLIRRQQVVAFIKYGKIT